MPYAIPIKALHHTHRRCAVTRNTPFAPSCGSHAATAAQPAADGQTQTLQLRHPERTLLYQTIAGHFETCLELVSASQSDGQGGFTLMHSAIDKLLALIASIRAALARVRAVAEQLPQTDRRNSLLDYVVAKITRSLPPRNRPDRLVVIG